METKKARMSRFMTLDEQKAICDKATPGPWQTRFMYRMFQSARLDPSTLFDTKPEDDWKDADFCTTARTEWPKLIEEHRKALDEIERLRNENRSLEIQLDAANLSWA